ncbi:MULTISPECIES: TonB-dependent receptor [unclassified Brevundimonas]|uniref:TonB-dependent receptor n=1 Tax=unclassified Brevundimonas TaxID=2622653 RepID=UPI0025BC2E4B|nr:MULTISPECIES: TonB-dependent receptor [unclassified Brevundimonas]
MPYAGRVRAKWAVTASVVALVGAIAPVALAQEADPTEVGEVIVTAQKREQAIRDVPIAVTALSAENLDSMKIEGGSELLRAVPNVTFSKSNFSMYNFAIRGVGTKAISASSDPAVAVSFNNTPLLRNRLFESEYLDVQRVEVLRGPQGTLYGRNATGGVVNMIPNLPRDYFEALIKVEGGNFGSFRGQAMINVPVTDTFSVRAAGSFTKRDGFDYNTFLGEETNGRDLWSTRVSAAWNPTDRFRANLVWEHFEEDDDRLRTGKTLCTKDPTKTRYGSVNLTNLEWAGRMNQGCLPGSLYNDAAYDTPNGLGLGQLIIASGIGMGQRFENGVLKTVFLLDYADPFAGQTQSKNLREIATSYKPKYVAENDVVQLNLEFDITPTLTFYSQTAYSKDDFYATQDYNRFVSNEIINSSDNLLKNGVVVPSRIAPGGLYNDPQLGASSRMESADLSVSDNKQIYQEFRLQSSNDGGFNFSLGANFLDFKTQDDYFVFNNLFSALAEWFYGQDGNYQDTQTRRCLDGKDPNQNECVYVDYSPLNDFVGDGHNYFRSLNKVHTRSWAAFGEGYWDIGEKNRLTVGLRYTEDRKTTTPYPSQLLLGYRDADGVGVTTGGRVARGYYALPDVEQSWNAVTGRAVWDWKPFDGMMTYASYSRGYKGGGTNPPRADMDPAVVQYQPLAETFDPEYLDAYEIGAKYLSPTGAFSLNVTAFYYDYQDYQVSQIVDRISLNENFNAESMGIEFESVWHPFENFRVDANVGFLKTRVADGEESIDIMNRTQGNEDWVLLRPWVQVPSNCIAPKAVVERLLSSPAATNFGSIGLAMLCGSAGRYGSFTPDYPGIIPFTLLTGITYDPWKDAPNRGRGFAADLSGNELPNAPRWTANVGAQYTWHMTNSQLTVRGDYYRQADSYFRVYNTEYDRIRGWDNVNLTATWAFPGQDLMIQAYVKNLFDDAPIVDAFTNSDDSLLTTNVFTLDPRLWGISLTKRF